VDVRGGGDEALAVLVPLERDREVSLENLDVI
jgi:hypothetical protein